MPSPFPGMAPYLEEPGLWPDVHHGLISQMQAVLNQQLRPRYYARVEERVYVSNEDDPGRSVMIPDLRIAERPHPSAPPPPSGEATVLEAEPVVMTTLIEEEIHEARLEVIDRASRQVVAVIEVVSPSNKAPGSRGRESYQEKRSEVMHSPSHWVEIDLLRSGATLLPNGAPPHDYSIHVSRAGGRPRGQVWPIRLPQRLPRVPIPLRGDDPDALLDLQGVLDAAYDRAGYDLMIDYRADPEPPLPAEYTAWAEELLRSRGLR